jgi:type IV pilus assembly protein PilM
LTASPTLPNVTKPLLYREALGRLGSATAGRRPAAAIVIPDYAVRMAMLDFESLPASEQERASLVRFRLRKTVPFPIEEAKLAYTVQWEAPGRVELLAVAIAQPILQEYEAIFVESGYRVGMVVPSVIAALQFCDAGPAGITLLVKIAGVTLSLVLMEQGRVRLVRCVDLSEEEFGERGREGKRILPMLQQTLAFAEDQLGQPVSRAIFCGFGKDSDVLGAQMEKEFGVPSMPVRSRFGPALADTAGLLGLLEQYAA